MKRPFANGFLAEQVQLLYDNSFSANLSVIGASLLLLALLYGRVDTTYLLIWWGSITCLAVFRLTLRRLFRQHRRRLPSEQWVSLYVGLTFLIGCAWAGLSLFIYLYDDIIVQTGGLLIIFGLSAAAVPVLSVMLSAFFVYILPPAVAAILTLLLKGGFQNELLALGTSIYTLLISVTGRNIHRNMLQTMALQVQNSELIETLNDEIKQRKTAQQMLEKHGEELEELVKRRTKQLLMINRNLEREINERKRAEDNLKHLAHHDPLTNLPNRLLLDARLAHTIERAHRTGSQVAVLFLDLDHFKHINDSLGHATGDRLLTMVGERLLNCIRENDTVARLGGDEFVVVMEQISTLDGVTQLAQKLMETLGTRFEIQDRTLFVSASIGISLFPQDGKDSETLLKNADAAMYQAKEQGRSNYVFYTRELTVTAYDRVMLEGSLRQALDQEEFVLFYQPQVSLRDGAITGVEALIRWDHPKLGLLPPGRFLPVAEESGLIIQIGEWVLRTACRQMTAWRMQGLDLPLVAVNISGKQIRKGDLVSQVRDILAETGCNPGWLELEISEDFIMKETEPSIETLKGLRELGTHLAIDDFGTGYSSLSYLKQLPIDKLKIDRSFIRDLNRDPNDEAIVRAIIAMGKGLQLKIIAEGVEDEGQELFLKKYACDEMQGFRYGRPMSADRIQQRYGRNACSLLMPAQHS